ncbi:MAG TPA: LuxR C-terminal-related transcriptional regulator [Solirubrobacteraceae bacterium]|nr:LuxR C-terminal-related transcriptional regulator [Solirubrobacteraceae bacterium]
MSPLALAMGRPSSRGGSSVSVLRLTRAATRAQRAWMATEQGSAPAATCAATALEALEGGVLLDTAARYSSYHLCVRVLILTDAFDAAGRAIAPLDERAGACAAAYRAELALRTGRVGDAERWAVRALELAREPQPGPFAGDAIAVLVSAHAERGAFREAERLIHACRAPHSTRLRHARARLMLAEGRFEDAYAEASEVGARRERQGRPNPTWDGWRSTAAIALAHLGRGAEATELAEAELAAARAFGARVPIARALAARAVAEPDHRARAELCAHGLTELGDRPAGLASVRLTLELGSALARSGHRAQAREALRPALADADRLGAVRLAQRARRELVATGVRPRRAATEGDAALTPRQREICELAAAGKGNRAIASELFVSIKTVETHLAAAYRKLGVGTRAGLAACLGIA